MDRYDDKARQIMDEVVRKHGDFYVTPTTLTTITAILRACDSLRAAGSGDKPVATEWFVDGDGDNVRHVTGRLVAYVRKDLSGTWWWNLHRRDENCDNDQQGRASTCKAAMAAADAWAREHASELDWQLPPAAAPQPERIHCTAPDCPWPTSVLGHDTCGYGPRPAVAPQPERELTEAELIECAIAARVALTDPPPDGMRPSKGTLDSVRSVLRGIPGVIPEWDRAVLSTAAAIRSRTAPPVTGETTPTVGQLEDELRKWTGGAYLVDPDKLRALLSTLSPAARREALAAIAGGDK